MNEQIFESNQLLSKPNDDMVSFEDCPYNCVKGWIVDPYRRSRSLCPHCEAKRKEGLRATQSVEYDENSVVKMLGLPMSYTGLEFNPDTVFPEFVLKDLISESVTEIKEVLKSYISDASLGVLPSHSVIFNFGKKVNEFSFISPLMKLYYIAGCTVTPLVTPYMLCNLRNRAERYGFEANNMLNYEDLLSRSVCVVDIDAGVTDFGSDAIKGLMQLRAMRGLATIIVTNAWGTRIQDLTSDTKVLNLAYMYSVQYTDKYKDKEKKREEQLGVGARSNQSGQMSNDAFKNLLKSKDTL